MDKKFFEAWAKSTGKSLKELQKAFEDAEAEVEKTYADKSVPERERLTKQLFAKGVRRAAFSKKKPESYFGFILGSPRARDLSENLRRKALMAWREDPTQAQLEGLVDEQGTPLDPRDKIGNRENPNFHKPLVEQTWVRDVWGIAVKEATKQPMIWKMTLWRGAAKHLSYKPFVPIEFVAYLKDMSKGFYVLSPSKLTKFQVTRRTIDIEKWIRDASKVKALSELKGIAQKQTGYDNWVFAEGDVDRIDLQIKPETNSRSLILSDADSGMMDTVRVFIPGDFPIGFSELSRVVVMGRPKLWKGKNGDEEEKVSMEGWSVYPLPGHTINTESTQEELEATPAQEEESNIIEFIEEPIE